jgi:hypothetical protein
VSPKAGLDGCGKFAPTAILRYRTMWSVLRLQNGKGKVHPRTGHEGPEGELRYSSTLSLTSALDGVGVNVTPRPLYPRERPGTHCIGG